MRAFSLCRPPSNIIQIGTIFYYRLAVPKDLRLSLKRAEYKFSLETSEKLKAQRKAGAITAIIWSMFDALRKGDAKVEKLSLDRIRELLPNYVSERLIEDDMERACREKFPSKESNRFFWEEDMEILDEEKAMEIEGLFQTEMLYGVALEKRDYSDVEENVEEFLKKNELFADKESREYKYLGRELLKAEIVIAREIAKKLSSGPCDLSYLMSKEASEWAIPEAKPKSQPYSTLKMSEAVKLFIEEKSIQRAWRTSTKEQNIMRLTQLVEWTKDPAITDISQDMLREVMRILSCYPKNKSKSKKYKTWTLTKLLKHEADIPEEDRLSVGTRGDYISLYNYFFGWLKTIYELPIWLDAILNAPKDNSSPNTKRAIFTTEDLNKIFSLPEYVNEDKTPYKFWLPLLALFTGARREELLQLALSDFIIKDDTKCFKITDLEDEDEEGDSAAGKHIKNKASRRVVPIHDELLNLGLWRYVEELRAKGCKRLFEELEPSGPDLKYGNSLSQSWYSRVLTKAGVKRDKVSGNKTFHSYRHTFITNCSNKLLPDKYVYYIVGHSYSSDVHSQSYEKGYPADDLKREVMDKVDFGIDLSHLKQHKFAR